MTRFLIIVCSFLSAAPLWGQFQQQVLYPNQSGEVLLDSLVTHFKPDSVLAYGPARDTMFALIDSELDSLACVYTGLTIYLDPDNDPTQDAFSKNINTEHTWPQSKGAASGFARSDMHHLYPTRVDVNADRGSFPFADIDDDQTQIWYYLDESLAGVPTLNIDQYSEKAGNQFEPREDHKGNVARSMFYFYTMYRAEVEAAAPTYFAQQRETLCQWHIQDPVDEKEWNRSQMIAPYQDDKPNPFVLDCTLPARSYCSDLDLECVITATKELVPNSVIAVEVSPNPFSNHIYLQYELVESAHVFFRFFNATGQQLDSLDIGYHQSGEQRLDWPVPKQLAPGTYFYQLIFTNSVGEQQVRSGQVVKIH